jgi:hypothetical protein
MSTSTAGDASRAHNSENISNKECVREPCSFWLCGRTALCVCVCVCVCVAMGVAPCCVEQRVVEPRCVSVRSNGGFRAALARSKEENMENISASSYTLHLD